MYCFRRWWIMVFFGKNFTLLLLWLWIRGHHLRTAAVEQEHLIMKYAIEWLNQCFSLMKQVLIDQINKMDLQIIKQIRRVILHQIYHKHQFGYKIDHRKFNFFVDILLRWIFWSEQTQRFEYASDEFLVYFVLNQGDLVALIIHGHHLIMYLY